LAQFTISISKKNPAENEFVHVALLVYVKRFKAQSMIERHAYALLSADGGRGSIDR
jgi:hypothetical protein